MSKPLAISEERARAGGVGCHRPGVLARGQLAVATGPLGLIPEGSRTRHDVVMRRARSNVMRIQAPSRAE